MYSVKTPDAPWQQVESVVCPYKLYWFCFKQRGLFEPLHKLLLLLHDKILLFTHFK